MTQNLLVLISSERTQFIFTYKISMRIISVCLFCFFLKFLSVYIVYCCVVIIYTYSHLHLLQVLITHPFTNCTQHYLAKVYLGPTVNEILKRVYLYCPCLIRTYRMIIYCIRYSALYYAKMFFFRIAYLHASHVFTRAS